MNEAVLLNEMRRIPVISGYNAISPFLEVRRKDTHLPINGLFSLNVETGESQVTRMDAAGQPALDESGRVIVETIFVDLNLFYIAFKAFPKNDHRTKLDLG